MKYFFALGNHPSLSAAEILAFFPDCTGKMSQNNIFVLESDDKINAQKTIKALGGTIKIGEVLFNAKNNEIPKACLDLALESAPNFSGKFHFGFSNYANAPIDTRKLGMTIKTVLKENGHSCRWVMGKEQVLSSVIVEQNYLLDKGMEIVFLRDNEGRMMVGQTLAVQPFKELSFRDFGRPTRDDESGMLPPKLAQIMINLSQNGQKDVILDPFCGSGTILSESLLMGYKSVIGTDISPKAIADTNENVEWIKDKFNITDVKVDTKVISATEIDKYIKPKSIAAIVTEPYLGPQRGHHEVRKTITELEDLYSKALKSFTKIIKPHSRVVMVWPVFLTVEQGKKKFIYMNPKYPDWNIVEDGNTQRKTWLYGREGQKVWREIVVLKLK
ncbi:MAG: DNA methyltransferase [Candidatus Falkowbacteria bacterium]